MKIAIIPARGGSKRIKNKNIIDFFGHPMMSYSLRAAQESGLFDKIHVSTDNLEIAQAADAAGFPIDFMRSPELADDQTPIMPVLQYVLGEYKKSAQEFDTVGVIFPCAPLIDADDLKKAHAIFSQHSPRKPLMAVGAFPVPVEWAYVRAANGTLTPAQPGMYKIRSQDLVQKYYDSGTFYFFDASHVSGQLPVEDTHYTSYELSKAKTVDIDNEEDLALAKVLFQGRRP